MSKTTSRKIIVLIMVCFIACIFIPHRAYASTESFSKLRCKISGKIVSKINTKIKWHKIDTVQRYVVYRATTKNGKYRKIVTVKGGQVTLKNTFKHTYYYTVKGYKIYHGEKIYTASSNIIKIKSRISRSFHVKAYAYHESGVCANGLPCAVGRIATDPRVIKTGTWLYVNGYGLCRACDTGGDIVGRTVDLYMSSESACDSWGVRYPKVYILK